MTESNNYSLGGAEGAANFLALTPGLKVETAAGAIGEIIENPGDGTFLLIKHIENAADPSTVGEEELVWFGDVKRAFE